MANYNSIINKQIWPRNIFQLFADKELINYLTAISSRSGVSRNKSYLPYPFMESVLNGAMELTHLCRIKCNSSLILLAKAYSLCTDFNITMLLLSLFFYELKVELILYF